MNKKIVITIITCLAICFVCAFSACSNVNSLQSQETPGLCVVAPQQNKEEAVESETQTDIQEETQKVESNTESETSVESDPEIPADDIVFVEEETVAVGETQYVDYDGFTLLLENVGDGYSIIKVESDAKSIRIPSTGTNIVSIADRAFRGLTNLEELIIECNTITSVGTYAFYNTPNLGKVTFPSSITNFGELSFYGSKYLNVARANDDNNLLVINDVIVDGRAAKGDLVIPSNIKSIAPKAFHNATELTSVSFEGSGVTRIPYQAFYGCKKLTSVNLSGIKNIADYAFTSCTSLESITGISVSLSNIGACAFKNDALLTKIDLSASNVSFIVGESAFENCSGITEVVFPLAINVIEKNAFKNCTALATIEFNSATNTLTTIGEWAFYGDYKLVTIKNQSVMPTPALNAFEGTQIVL